MLEAKTEAFLQTGTFESLEANYPRYLPAKLGDKIGVNVGTYSSTKDHLGMTLKFQAHYIYIRLMYL